jgi:filamin
MAWLQSVLPEIRLTNFQHNWNDGIALSALVDYCNNSGGLIDWQHLDATQKYAIFWYLGVVFQKQKFL